ncbi:MAG: hypothetical protein LQ337_000851 [Flavoplaca oasis]|nr:MAG: hypothetical protein LQ337_000851 [Flavoplaca oasis]
MRGFLLVVTYTLYITPISFAAIISKSSLPEVSTADALPSRELTIPNGPILQSGNSGLGAQDPRFFTLVKDGDEDLPDKPVFMNILAVLRELSRQQFNDHFHGGEWSILGYDNVAVHIPPHPRLQVNYAMWGLNQGVAHMNGKGYQSVEARMFLNGGRGVGPVEVGIIRILKSNRVNRKTETDPAPLPPRAQLAANVTASRNTSSVDGNSVSGLGTPNYNLRPNFQGPRLSTYGVFASLFAAITEVASWDRSRPIEAQGQTVGGVTNVALKFRPWVFQPSGPPYLYYDPMMWMFDRVAKYMIRYNRFNAGEFVLLVNDQPVGFGEFSRLRRRAAHVAEE